MRIPRLFIDMPLASGETVLLPRDKAHYISNVLRMRAADPIKLFNNLGYEYEARVVDITKKAAQIKVLKSIQIDNESPLKITLCLAIARGQHMDFSIQKAVELGVYNIVPVISEFSNVKLEDSRVQNKLTHWQNIIISAAEQCGRNRLTQLQKPLPFTEWLQLDTSMKRLILHPASQQSLSDIGLQENELSLIIGPEGGFSDHELKSSEEKGCIPISMGPRILRTETAVVAAVSNAQQLWGDLN